MTTPARGLPSSSPANEDALALTTALRDRRVVGRFLVGIGVLGALASLAGTVVAVRFLTQLGDTLDGSIGVTADAVDALGSTVEVAGETVTAVERVLSETATTTRDLAVAVRDAEQALAGVARLSDREVASSLEAVEASLPALIDVAGVIDRTLSGLSSVPFGPDYDPDEPFDDSLRTVQREFAALPEALRDQAARIRDAGDGLATVRRGTTRVADDLGTLQATMASTGALLEGYAATAEEAQEVVTGGADRLRASLAVGRTIAVVLGLVFLAGQVVPLGLGWALLRPEAAAAFLTARPVR